MDFDIEELKKKREQLIMIGNQKNVRLGQLERERIKIIADLNHMRGQIAELDWMIEQLQPPEKEDKKKKTRGRPSKDPEIS